MERFIDVFGLKNCKKLPDDELYVMLMLMRASEGSEPVKADCEDPMIKAACLLDSDKCPAECKDEEKEDNTVVKSGDLAVKATAATERKAILDGGVSDLDTITLKASEKITVNSITLERFGYSTANDVDAIWLEDGDGNKIADEKSLSSTKDTVTLKIKKEYREMDASNALTIVLRTTEFEEDVPAVVAHCEKDGEAIEAADAEACGTAGGEWIPAKDAVVATYTAKKAGSTIGFKVTDVDASAKNLDISDYNPYTYELVSYDGTKVTVSSKGNNKTYNYEEGQYYEVSRLRVKAGASILSLNGITLTNKGTTIDGDAYAALDLDEFVSKVKVTADGKEVSGLKYNVTKDNELVLNWDTIEVAINKDVQLVISIAMENLDEFDKVVYLELKESGDLNAVEKKTGARVSVTAPEAYKYYLFHGSKIKFSNTKLSSTIDAAQGASDVVIAQGKVTVGEEVKISELVFTADKADIIEAMKLTIAGESYDASVSSDKKTFKFRNVFIEKSGDVELSVDVIDEEGNSGKTVTVKYDNANTSIGKNVFADDVNGRYETSRKPVLGNDVSGSISISSLKVQESKASLKNNKSTTVEFVKDETSDRTTIFEGTYTAKKSDITLKEFAIVGDVDQLVGDDTTAEFYLYIDGEEVGNIEKEDIVAKDVATADGFDGYENSDEVEVAAGKSVKVEVKAVIAPSETSDNNINLDLYLRGEDKNGTAAGFAKAGLTSFKFVLNGSLTISDGVSLSKKTVVVQNNDIIVAKFNLKPSKSDSVKLDNLIFDLSGLGEDYDTAQEVSDKITITVDGTDVDLWEGKFNNADYVYAANNAIFDATDVDDITEEVEVEVKVTGLASAPTSTKDAPTTAANASLTLKSVNGVNKNSTYTRLVLPAIVKFDSQTSDGAVTTYRVDVDDYDGAQISNLRIYKAEPTNPFAEGADNYVGMLETVSDGSEFDATNGTNAEVIKYITYEVSNGDSHWYVKLDNTSFSDYFKTTDGKALRTLQTKDN